jgi:phage replication O-like protein O
MVDDFRGFKRPQFTRTPNVIFDDLMRKLTDSELRVLLVIVRKTLGWRRENQSMSFAIMADLAGVNRSSAIRAVEGLSSMGLIEKSEQMDDSGDFSPNCYSLKFEPEEEGGWSHKETTGGLTEGPPVVSQRDYGSLTVRPYIRSKETKEKKPGKENPLDENFLNPSEERLDPDVEQVQYLDVEPARSKQQTWKPGDRSAFWGQWKRKFGSKPIPRDREIFNRWLAYKDPKQAVTAVNGYGSSTASPSIEEFKAGYWEYFKSGDGQERAESVPFEKKAASTLPAPENSPASFMPQDAISRWNSLVPSRAVTDWNPRLDAQRALAAACEEPEFIDNFDDLCQRVEAAVVRTNPKWLTFRWILKQSNRQPVNWWRILKGCLDDIPKEKHKPTHEETNSNVMKRLMGEI